VKLQINDNPSWDKNLSIVCEAINQGQGALFKAETVKIEQTKGGEEYEQKNIIAGREVPATGCVNMINTERDVKGYKDCAPEVADNATREHRIVTSDIRTELDEFVNIKGEDSGGYSNNKINKKELISNE
jgi:hypothetical protein